MKKTNADNRPMGDCYKAAYYSVQELESTMKSDESKRQPLYLVHGTVIAPRGLDKGRLLEHAWVELGNNAIEVSLGQQIDVSQKAYYNHFKATLKTKYTPEEEKFLGTQ